MSDFAERIHRLQKGMRADGAALTLLAGSDHMRYLTGWADQGHERLVALFVPADGEPAFLVPAMNAPQARANRGGISQVLGWNDETGWHAEARQLIARWPLPDGSRILIDEELYSGHLLGLQALFPNMRYAPVGSVMTSLRAAKSADEIAAMTAAGALIDRIMEETLSDLKEGVTELEIQSRLHAAFRDNATRPSFTPTVCFGANSALPHHQTSDAPLKRGDVIVIDIGCVWDGYPSDITRTFAYDEPADKDAAAVYRIVDRAHHAAREAAMPGATGAAVDKAARDVITEAGYGEYFTHRTGHGIGLSVHEPPDVVASNRDPLPIGACFSIEPGIYLPGRFGVRIENIYTLTPEGARSLNAEPPHELRVIGQR